MISSDDQDVQETPVVAKRMEEGGDGSEAPPPLQRDDYPKHDSVFRVKATDPKQRAWFVFDHYLVRPPPSALPAAPAAVASPRRRFSVRLDTF